MLASSVVGPGWTASSVRRLWVVLRLEKRASTPERRRQAAPRGGMSVMWRDKPIEERVVDSSQPPV